MDIDRIIQMAKDHILKTGHHLPEIIVEFNDQEMCILGCPDITNSEKNLEKQHRFFTAGRMLGEDNPGTEIASIAFAAEAWLATNRDAPSPSKNPDRKEILVINTLDINAKGEDKHVEQHMHTYELIRNGAGKLIDLLDMGLGQGEAGGTLLTAFLAGFVSTQISQERRDDLIAKMMGPDATGEEVRAMSKRIYERDAHFESYDLSDIPRKSGKTSYRKAKKHKK